ncbi:bifunctional 3'-5' exonuclease/DNA polymerase [Modestobacter sp. Leaf380]|uniref:bifunctional 3'-5' exonuclease/DNA polymerase n=1 Tax=Modestobacter sp. Leaf380 TaxID=1736356 RepID=UPI001F29F19D|nr:bifunctional 3'-5' exonuclease/DNA polymerase [Modestobacter sp. Leaf380]
MLRSVVLVRRGDDVEAHEDGTVTRLGREDLPAWVAAREPGHPRWVWDDATRWYPGLLAAGVRVERCTDLRLCHGVLRRSAHVDQTLLAGADTDGWDALSPVTADEPALFALADPADRLDPIAELARQQAALAASPELRRLGLLLAAESAGALVAAEMQHAGMPWRADVHDRLLRDLLGPRPVAGQRPAVLERLLPEIRAAFGQPVMNPDSPTDLLASLRAAGLEVTDTRSWTLREIEHPGVEPLLRYKKLLRLMHANGWSWLDAWVRDGRFRPVFLPAGVVTGRWASQGGGALSAPVQLRPAAVADEGWRFVVADVAQLEPRVLAGMSRDAAMAEAARARDLYQGMVDSGAVETRTQAKLGILGAMYGGTRGESGAMLPRLTRRYPAAVGLVEQAARAGERGEVVSTLLGRGSPRPGPWSRGDADDPATGRAADSRRRAWGRFTRNFVVQGTGAEWASCWLADLRNRLWRLGDGLLTDRPHLVFFLHDEVVVHSPAALADDVAEVVRAAAVEAGRLLFGSFPVDFPLDVAVVRSWADADAPLDPAAEDGNLPAEVPDTDVRAV